MKDNEKQKKLLKECSCDFYYWSHKQKGTSEQKFERWWNLIGKYKYL